MKPFSRIHSKQQDMGICPRCEGLIPSNDHYGKYVGAISRLTRGQDAHLPLEICSTCGQEEALQEHFEKFATPVKDWPVMTADAIVRRSEAFDILHRDFPVEWADEDDTEF